MVPLGLEGRTQTESSLEQEGSAAGLTSRLLSALWSFTQGDHHSELLMCFNIIFFLSFIAFVLLFFSTRVVVGTGCLHDKFITPGDHFPPFFYLIRQ